MDAVDPTTAPVELASRATAVRMVVSPSRPVHNVSELHAEIIAADVLRTWGATIALFRNTNLVKKSR